MFLPICHRLGVIESLICTVSRFQRTEPRGRARRHGRPATGRGRRMAAACWHWPSWSGQRGRINAVPLLLTPLARFHLLPLALPLRSAELAIAPA